MDGILEEPILVVNSKYIEMIPDNYSDTNASVPRVIKIEPKSLCNLPPGAGVYQCIIYLMASEERLEQQVDQRIIVPKSPIVLLGDDVDCRCHVKVEVGGYIHVIDDCHSGFMNKLANLEEQRRIEFDSIFLALDFERKFT